MFLVFYAFILLFSELVFLVLAALLFILPIEKAFLFKSLITPTRFA